MRTGASTDRCVVRTSGRLATQHPEWKVVYRLCLCRCCTALNEVITFNYIYWFCNVRWSTGDCDGCSIETFSEIRFFFGWNVNRKILFDRICKGKRSLARNGSQDLRVTWRMLPQILWTQNETSTGMNVSTPEQHKFSNVSATKRYRRRRVYVLHPTVLSSPSPSFTPRLYHRPRTSLNTHKCPDFKMQKRRKKHRNFAETASVRSLKTRGIM
jgi:hypothetical protein